VINFYLKELPSEGQLFLDFQTMAVGDLVVNEKLLTENETYSDQKIPLEKENLVQGWNTVQLKYMRTYNKNQVGLHSFTDSKDGE
jgi:hypothetical protein